MLMLACQAAVVHVRDGIELDADTLLTTDSAAAVISERASLSNEVCGDGWP
jgi:hypothetical protein